MTRYIDADKALEIARTKDACELHIADFQDFKEVIEDTPTANVIEVVRCKNCKFYKKDTDYCKEHNKGYCEWDNTIKNKSHFCSYGEKEI